MMRDSRSSFSRQDESWPPLQARNRECDTGIGITVPVSKALDECREQWLLCALHEVRMNRPRVLGIETQYMGRNRLLRGALVRVESVIRGSVRDRARRAPEVTDDEELWRRPVAP